MRIMKYSIQNESGQIKSMKKIRVLLCDASGSS